MSNYTDMEAIASNAKNSALQLMEARTRMSQETQAAILSTALKMSIQDKLVDPKAMSFTPGLGKGPIDLSYGDTKAVHVHAHALGQMADVAKIPRRYVRNLVDGCVGIEEEVRHPLLCHVLGIHYSSGEFKDRRGNDTKFLHRLVDGELRGFLSRNYNRKLGSVTMLKPFIEECMHYGAKPIDLVRTPVKMTVRYALPTIFEPVSGEFVVFGLNYSNSDFGAGSLQVAGIVMRVSSGTMAVLGDKMSRVHLGAVIEESEIALSEETLEREAAAHISAVRDMVKSQLSPENIANVLKMIEYAHQKQMSWTSLKDKLRDVLHKKELESVEEMLKEAASGVIDLPPVTTTASGDPVATAWWASAVLGTVAQKVDDADRKESIHVLAGKLLEK